MKLAYRILAGLVSLGVAVQAAAIAFATFSLGHALDGGAQLSKNGNVGVAGFALHSIDGEMIIPVLAILLFIVSFMAKIPSGVKWAGFILIDIVVEVALGFISQGVPALGWLHGLNALILFALAFTATNRIAGGAPRANAPAAESVHQ